MLHWHLLSFTAVFYYDCKPAREFKYWVVVDKYCECINVQPQAVNWQLDGSRGARGGVGAEAVVTLPFPSYSHTPISFLPSKLVQRVFNFAGSLYQAS